MFGGSGAATHLAERLLGYPDRHHRRSHGAARNRHRHHHDRGRTAGDQHVDARYLVLTGPGRSARSAPYGMTYYSLDVTQLNIIWPAFLQGIGLGLGVRAAFDVLPRDARSPAAWLRPRAFSAWCAPIAVRPSGISIVTTLLAHQSQILWNELGAYVSPVSRGAGGVHAAHAPATHRSAQALAVVARERWGGRRRWAPCSMYSS